MRGVTGINAIKDIPKRQKPIFGEEEKIHGLSPRRTIPTERPPLVSEVSANFMRIEGATWSA
jgi:hypothetical protein